MRSYIDILNENKTSDIYQMIDHRPNLNLKDFDWGTQPDFTGKKEASTVKGWVIPNEEKFKAMSIIIEVNKSDGTQRRLLYQVIPAYHPSDQDSEGEENFVYKKMFKIKPDGSLGSSSAGLDDSWPSNHQEMFNDFMKQTGIFKDM